MEPQLLGALCLTPLFWLTLSSPISPLLSPHFHLSCLPKPDCKPFPLCSLLKKLFLNVYATRTSVATRGYDNTHTTVRLCMVVWYGMVLGLATVHGHVWLGTLLMYGYNHGSALSPNVAKVLATMDP